jgi:hypothetical protein
MILAIPTKAVLEAKVLLTEALLETVVILAKALLTEAVQVLTKAY